MVTALTFCVASSVHGQGAVRVTVEDSGGNLLAGAGVCLFDNDLGPAFCGRAPCAEQTTGAGGILEGRARFLDVPQGQYVLIAYLDGYVGRRLDLDLDALGAAGTDVTVDLQAGDSLSGPTCDNPEQGNMFIFPDGVTLPLLPFLLGITGFTLDDGAAITADEEISIQFTTTLTGFFFPAPIEFRVSEDPGFVGAGWQEPTLISAAPLPSYGAPLAYTLTGGPGSRTLYLQARYRNMPDNTSDVVEAEIELLQTYVADLRSLFAQASAGGWTFTGARGFIFVFRCGLKAAGAAGALPSGILMIATQHVFGFAPVTCNFTLFGGRELNPGWFFESYQITDGTTVAGMCDPAGTVTINKSPSPGDTNILLDVTVHTGGPTCRAVAGSITLKGPAERKFEEAFVP